MGGELSLVGVLIDLARYNDDRLLTKSLQLIDRIYSSEQDLFDLAVQAKVLQTGASKRMLVLKDLLPSLKRIGSRSISGQDTEEFNTSLLFLTSKCYWEGELESKRSHILFGSKPYEEAWENPGPANATNQQIILNSGVLPIILNVIHRENQPRSVLRNCYWFLRAMCVSFPEVQISLYESLDAILSTTASPLMTPEDTEDEMKFESWENAMGGTINEIFNNCRETCLRVTADQVEKMLARIGEGDAEKTYRTAKLLDALRAVAKVEEWNLPLKRNQQIIIKFLWAERTRVIDIAEIDELSDPAINTKRKLLLTREFCKLDKQRYHLNLVKLISATCEGENRQIEAMCRSIFTLDELIETMSLDASPGSDKVPNINKGPYIAFFLWAYLNTGSSTVEIGTDKLSSESRVFHAFAEIATQEVAEYVHHIDELTQDQCEFVYDIFIPAAAKLVEDHFPKETEIQKMVFLMALSISDFLNVALEGTNTTGINRFRAQYAVELFNSLQKRLMADEGQGGRISALRPTVDERRRFELAYNAVNTEALKLSAGVANNAAAKAYLDRYQDEEETNTRFNNFCRNLEKVYKADNTIHAQLDLSGKYSQFLEDDTRLQPYCGEPGTDLALPLGPEFQHLLALFSKINNKGEFSMDVHGAQVLVRLFEAFQSAATTSEQDRNANARVSVKMLQVVRAAVHNVTQLGLAQSNVLAFQDAMTDIGAVLTISRMFSASSADVRKQALGAFNTILHGGNKRAQGVLQSYFLGTREETFFDDVAALIELSNESITNLRILREQKAAADETSRKLQDTMRGTLTKRMQNAKQRGNINTDAANPDSLEIAVTTKEQRADNEVAEKEDPLEMKDHGNLQLILLGLQASQITAAAPCAPLCTRTTPFPEENPY